MPVIQYDPGLMADVVFPLLNGVKREKIRARYHVESEVLYAKYSPEHRGEAFAALDDRTFRALPQHEIFEKALADAGSMEGVHKVVVTGAVGNEEGADLNAARDAIVVRVRPARLHANDEGENSDRLRAFLLHELLHLVDLLDPSFGYQREDPAPGEMHSRKNLVRDRYRVLWNAAVDGRLARRHETLPGTEQARREDVLKVFSSVGTTDASDLFEQAWSGQLFEHSELLAAARSRENGKTEGLKPGGICPLCGFSTWDVASTTDAVSRAEYICADNPAWTPEDGLCGQCLALYQIRQIPVQEKTWKSNEETC